MSDTKLELATKCINGEIRPGDVVISTGDDDYAYLVGRVIRIAAKGSAEHETDNPYDDVYVDFKAFEYSKQRIEEIETLLSGLYMDDIKYEDCSLDEVIMAPDFLVKVTGISKENMDHILDCAGNAAEVTHRAKQKKELFPKTVQENRVNADNTINKLPIEMVIKVRPIEPKGSVVGFADVTFNGLVTVHDIRIINGERGMFVAMPSRADASSKSGFRNIVTLDTSFKESLNTAVIDTYRDELKDTYARKDNVLDELQTSDKKEADAQNIEQIADKLVEIIAPEEIKKSVMSKYEVNLNETSYGFVTVEAENAEAARDAALGAFYNGDVQWPNTDVEVVKINKITDIKANDLVDAIHDSAEKRADMKTTDKTSLSERMADAKVKAKHNNDLHAATPKDKGIER